ncbi:integral membrane protein 2C-like isoform X2 [Hippocampus comes]|uniref:integral membrane protein 2C-like isoform X2 n=1 Tax=Hippocampus comes TaxID=109280 RepID=UPI00094E1651|nr:PREDICTED: integral membrane protein 2C-like isoform X2 [Hippocampus comes]
MVRIFFRASSSDKGDKEEELVVNELDQDRDQDLESTSAHIKRYFPVRLCVIMIAVLVILLGLLLGSIYTYRHFHPSKLYDDLPGSGSSVIQVYPSVQLDDDLPGGGLSVIQVFSPAKNIITLSDSNLRESADEFKCHVVFEDRNSQVELTMDVAISLEKNYEYITVVKMGRRDHPFDIIHDFEHSKTAYYDKQLSKCFVGPLNTVVLYPHNLREMLSNTESEIYLADNYVFKEVMKVTGLLTNEEMSPTIQEMCRGRETYEMQRGDPAIQNYLCREITYFESRYIVITYMCT